MITISPYKNWIHFNFYLFTLTLAVGQHTSGNEVLNLWYIASLKKLRLSSRWFEVILCRRINQ